MSFSLKNQIVFEQTNLPLFQGEGIATNLDFRGFEQDFEINAFMYDENLARQQHDLFIEDQKDAELIDPLEWDKRPLLDKARESAARIFSQVL